MNESDEFVVSDLPFIVRRTARWPDCDPAGVVYAGRYTDYLLSAVMHLLRAVRGVPTAVSPEIGLPCKHMALTFHASLWPDQCVDIHLHVTGVREHTFQIIANARFDDGRPAFDGVFVSICVDALTRSKVALPAALRAALLPHTTSVEGTP